ncbi:MAG: PA0069 family radical SAM protein [Proteobacteria bacterium]|nr:MAG: PA0069 family radical SAM protein [Pseudomonadota bacterium]
MTIHRGRGAVENPTGRFQANSILREPGEEPALSTEFFTDHTRSILARNDSPDIPFNLSVNPYRGCEHGCTYCYARPSHEFLGFSAGLDFESRILIKEEAAELLRAELMKKSYRPEVINLSGVTDCYQPIEREKRITRACIEVLREFKNPFSIITKNNLVTRDIDLIAPMAEVGAAAVFISITTLSDDLAAKLEPRASRPGARLAAIERLSAAGIPVGVIVAPVIPGLTDHEMPGILKAAAAAGACRAAFTPLRLPFGVADLFTRWLEEHYPLKKEKVLSQIREVRGGKLNDPNFTSRMKGEGDGAALLGQLFRLHCAKFGLNREGRRFELTTGHFARPGEQLRLLF